MDKKAHRIDRSWKCQICIGKGRICSLVRRRFESGKLLLMEIMNFCDEFLWQFFVMNFVTFVMNSGDIRDNFFKEFLRQNFVTFVTNFCDICDVCDNFFWQIFVTNICDKYLWRIFMTFFFTFNQDLVYTWTFPIIMIVMMIFAIVQSTVSGLLKDSNPLDEG